MAKIKINKSIILYILFFIIIVWIALLIFLGVPYYYNTKGFRKEMAENSYIYTNNEEVNEVFNKMIDTISKYEVMSIKPDPENWEVKKYIQKKSDLDTLDNHIVISQYNAYDEENTDENNQMDYNKPKYYKKPGEVRISFADHYSVFEGYDKEYYKDYSIKIVIERSVLQIEGMESDRRIETKEDYALKDMIMEMGQYHDWNLLLDFNKNYPSKNDTTGYKCSLSDADGYYIIRYELPEKFVDYYYINKETMNIDKTMHGKYGYLYMRADY